MVVATYFVHKYYSYPHYGLPSNVRTATLKVIYPALQFSHNHVKRLYAHSHRHSIEIINAPHLPHILLLAEYSFLLVIISRFEHVFRILHKIYGDSNPLFALKQ